jgi:hypothetical protein
MYFSFVRRYRLLLRHINCDVGRRRNSLAFYQAFKKGAGVRMAHEPALLVFADGVISGPVPASPNVKLSPLDAVAQCATFGWRFFLIKGRRYEV